MVWYCYYFIMSTYRGVIIPPLVGDPPHVKYFTISPTYPCISLSHMSSLCALLSLCLALISRLIYIVCNSWWSSWLVFASWLEYSLFLSNILSLLCYSMCSWYWLFSTNSHMVSRPLALHWLVFFGEILELLFSDLESFSFWVHPMVISTSPLRLGGHFHEFWV